RSQQAHAEDIQLLTPHVFAAHVNYTVESEQRTDCSSGDAMLTCSGLCNDASLAHASSKQPLANAVIDLVRASVEQIFPLEINKRASEFLSQSRRAEERSRASSVLAEQSLKFILEFLILLRTFIRSFEFFKRRHEHFGHVASTVWTKSACSRTGAYRFPLCFSHRVCSLCATLTLLPESNCRTASMNLATSPGCLRPG